METLIIGAVKNDEQSVNVCEVLEKWRGWNERGGMTIDELDWLEGSKVAFCNAVCAMGLLREVCSKDESTVAADMRKCVEQWKKVRLDDQGVAVVLPLITKRYLQMLLRHRATVIPTHSILLHHYFENECEAWRYPRGRYWQHFEQRRGKQRRLPLSVIDKVNPWLENRWLVGISRFRKARVVKTVMG